MAMAKTESRLHSQFSSIVALLVLLLVALVLCVVGGVPMGVTGSAIASTDWTDDFESYEVGVFPSPPWYNSGNTAAYVDDAHSVSGGKSLRLFGVLGSCWGALAHRQLDVQPPLLIECYVYNGSDALSGCHTMYGYLALNTGPTWTSSSRELIGFDVDDQTGERIIRGCWQYSPNEHDPVRGPNLGSFQEEAWYKVTIGYIVIDQTVVRIAYWINDTFEGWYEYPAFSYERDLTYLSLQAGEGSAWFDDVNVSQWVTGVGEQHQTLGTKNFTSVEPNPFNPMCTIRYDIPRAGRVNLEVFDVNGSLVRTLVDGWREPGVYSEIWDGRDNTGKQLPSGVYFYRLEAGDFVATRKCVLLR